MRKLKFPFAVILIPCIFLFFAVLTIKDYGINWDEPFHFMRGQAYLHYYLTGEKDYRSLPKYPRINKDCDYITAIPCTFSPSGPLDRKKFDGNNLIYEEEIKRLYSPNEKIWRSYYQHDTYNFDEIIKTENGHPAIGDILSAVFNYVFYQKLHIFGDIESYHLFEVFTSFLIVLGVSVIVYLELGVFASIVASLSLSLYPLFFSESHFNIKDPPETAFFGLAIILFYVGINKNKWVYMALSAIFTGLAVGTKFNAFFIAPILGLWLIYYVFLIKWKHRNNKLLFISLFAYPFIVAVIFYALWPYLWTNSVDNFLNIVKFYKQIGIGTPVEMARYVYNGWNTYPIIWIIYTTPLPILVLSIIGFIVSIYQSIFKKNSFSFLIILWFIIPILRVSIFNASIYGGVRQLMEFIPAMAILTGIGTHFMLKIIKFPKLFAFTVCLSLFFVTWEMIRIHPNQNVYFNQLIGGLSGAKAKNIPYWGNSYGNAYQQGVDWLNKNAEPNAKIGLPISTMGNIPWIKFRSDLEFNNASWSGPKRLGEYEIELNFDWSPTTWYSFAYFDTYLNPVYEVKVDDVSILKVWKNDFAHTKDEFKKESEFFSKEITYTKNLLGTSLKIDIGENILLTRLVIGHSKTNCNNGLLGYVALSDDNKNWRREIDPITHPQIAPTVDESAIGWSDTNFVYMFAGKKARYIMLDPEIENSCILKNSKIRIFGINNKY